MPIKKTSLTLDKRVPVLLGKPTDNYPTLLGIQDNDERVYLNALNGSLINNDLDTLYYVFAGLEDGKMEIF
jgi:hypothetical protein